MVSFKSRRNTKQFAWLHPLNFKGSHKGALKIQRRGRDLNPRNLAVYRFSRPAVSTTHTPLQFCCCRVAGANNFFYYTKLLTNLKIKAPNGGSYVIQKSILFIEPFPKTILERSYIPVTVCPPQGLFYRVWLVDLLTTGILY